MGIFFAYSLKSALCLAAFYLFYKVLLSRDTFHRFNRIALLSMLFLSLLIPFLATLFQGSGHVESGMEIPVDLIGTVVSAETGASGGIPVVHRLFSAIILIYLTGCLICLVRSVVSFSRILRLLGKGRHTRLSRNTRLVVHNDIRIAPFSWLKYIVVSKKDLAEAGETILLHEQAHLHHRHTTDLLLAELCILFQWYNPVAWLLYQELQNIHEFEADQSVLNQGIDARKYQLLLIKKAVGTRCYSMANSFNHSNLKKRITMMIQKKSSSWARLKYIYVLPLAAISIAAFARSEVSRPFDEISSVKVSYFISMAKPVEVKNVPDEAILPVPAASEAEQTRSTASAQAVVPTASKTVKAVSATPVKTVTPIASKTDKTLPTASAQAVTPEDTTVYTVVEHMPEFPGGLKALMTFIGENIIYPEKAKTNEIQGRVTVRFVVDKDGSIRDAIILRGVDPELDAEALRVINLMPKWKPGTQRDIEVAVYFTFPIAFKLSKKK